MKIFITGASGYIGNRMAEVLLEKDWVTGVVGTDIKCHGTSGRKKNGRRL